MGNMVGGLFGTQFLGEPAYRWAVFTVMMLLFLVVMGAILRHM